MGGLSVRGSVIAPARVSALETKLTNQEIIFILNGELSVDDNQTNHRLVNHSGEVISAIANVKNAPVGNDIIIQVQKWHDGSATDLFTGGMTILDGNTANETVIIDSAVSSFVAGDYFTIDIDQVGSSVAGEGLTVLLEAEGE